MQYSVTIAHDARALVLDAYGILQSIGDVWFFNPPASKMSMTLSDEIARDPDEVTFYDNLEVNDSTVELLGDPVLKKIAQ